MKTISSIACKLNLVVLFTGCSFSFHSSATEILSMCKKTEKTYFNCVLRSSHKIASLCGNADNSPFWLQYRIGRNQEKSELVAPVSREDPEMNNFFFYSAPSMTADGSFSEVGIWFHNVDTTYELITSQNHQFLVGKDDLSAINVWKGKADGAPVELQCQKPSSSELLTNAGELIKATAPPWHHWSASPYDWKNYVEQQENLDRLQFKKDSTSE